MQCNEINNFTRWNLKTNKNNDQLYTVTLSFKMLCSSTELTSAWTGRVFPSEMWNHTQVNKSETSENSSALLSAPKDNSLNSV